MTLIMTFTSTFNTFYDFLTPHPSPVDKVYAPPRSNPESATDTLASTHNHTHTWTIRRTTSPNVTQFLLSKIIIEAYFSLTWNEM